MLSCEAVTSSTYYVRFVTKISGGEQLLLSSQLVLRSPTKSLSDDAVTPEFFKEGFEKERRLHSVVADMVILGTYKST